MRYLIIGLLFLTTLTRGFAQTATPITSEPSQTTAMVAGKVLQGSMQVFTVEASAGAPLGLYLMSADSNASFEVTDPDGNLLCQGQADNFGARQWKGQLGPGGIDTIVVYSDSGTADFQLTVTKP